MDRTYNVGADDNSISFEVKTGTASTCFTGAFQVLDGGQRVPKGESLQADNGAIKTTVLGKSSTLKGTKLAIQSMADFSALPASIIDAIKTDSHALKVNLKIEYVFTGGTAGLQVFDYDYDDSVISSSGKTVVITKNIILAP